MDVKECIAKALVAASYYINTLSDCSYTRLSKRAVDEVVRDAILMIFAGAEDIEVTRETMPNPGLGALYVDMWVNTENKTIDGTITADGMGITVSPVSFMAEWEELVDYLQVKELPTYRFPAIN